MNTAGRAFWATMLLALGTALPAAAAIDASWTGTSGNWADGAKWSTNPDVPDQIDDIARLTTGAGPTTLNQSGVVLGQLINDQNKGWIVNTDVNNYSVTFQVGTGSALIRAKNGSNVSITINPNVIIASDLTIRSERADKDTQAVTLNGTLTGNGNVTADFAGSGNNASGNITLASLGTTGTLTVQGNNSANGTMTATIGAIGSGVTTLTKTGSCRLILTSANSYSGATTISGGTARFSNAAGLPASSYLQLNGGVFETIADMTRSGGTAAGEVSITADNSGISARGAPIVVAIGGTVSPTALTWGTAPFALAAANGTLLLNASTADNTLEFKNAINLGGSGSNARTLSIGANVVTVSGVLSASGGTQSLTKIGAGTLVLSNGANSYNGTTTISVGVLRANDGTSLPATGNLNLAGGVFETGANMLRNGGSAAGEVRITAASSGFSANGSPVVVAIGGISSPTALTWGTAPFAPSTALILNGVTANNTLEFRNAINFNAATRTVQTDANVTTLSGVLSTSSGTAGLTKTGAGTLVLSNVNTYNGTNTVSAGVVRANDGSGLPSTANLKLAGGVFETGVNMVRTGGISAGEVQITAANSGFSACGAPVVVAIGGLATPTALTWGTAPFNPSSAFILNASTADNTLEFKNAINFNGATRTVQTVANTATLSGLLSNSSGTFGLTKTGAGTLVLANNANSYNGTTTISVGVLRANDGTSLPATGNLNLAGGVLETGVNVVRNGGSSAGQVQITAANSGFSAYGAAVVVAIGGTSSPTALTWDTAPFAPGAALILNGATANNTLEFKNAIDLGSSGANTRTISNAVNVVTVSGVLSSAGGTQSLTKTGAGTLVLSVANTYNGDTTVSAGTLLVNGSLDARTTTVTVNAGATLGGSGTIARAVTVAGTLTPGSAGIGTLTVDLGTATSGVTLNSGAKLAYELGAAGSADRLRLWNVVAGDLVLNNNVINFTDVGGVGPGTYILMSFYSNGGTTLTDTGKPTSGLQIGTGLEAYSGSYIDYSVLGLIQLVIPAPPGAPQLNVNLGAGGIGTAGAWLRGTLTDKGGSATELTSVWGTSDHGIDSLSDWAPNSHGFGSAELGSYSNRPALSADTHYFYRFHARNTSLENWSALAEFDTAIALAPTITSAQGVSDTSVALGWSGTFNTESAFFVNYTNAATNATQSAAANATGLTVSNLRPLTTYAFRVAASNSAGLGPWSAWSNATTPATTIDTGWIGTDGNWSDAAKWSNGVPQYANDTARLAVGGTRTSTLDMNNVTLGSLINDLNQTWTIATNTSAYALRMQASSGSAVMRAKGKSVALLVRPDVVIASPLIVTVEATDNLTPTLTLSGALTGTGNVTLSLANAGGSDNATRVINVAALNPVGTLTAQGNTKTGDTSTVGPIGGNVTTLTKTGVSTLVLTGANAYTGPTAINGGTVRVTATGSLGAANVSVANGATLRIQNSSAIANMATLALSLGATLNLDFPVTELEAVAALVTNGTTVADGIYSAANMSAFITGTGRLQVGTPILPPTVSVDAGAAGITTGGAWLRGSVTADGGAAASLWSAWGTTDHGNTSVLGDWGASTHAFGPVTVGVTYSNFPALSPDTHFYYRFYASNSNEHAWSAAVASFDTAIAAAPALASAVALNDTQVQLTWSGTFNTETGFVVQHTNNTTDVRESCGANGTSYTVGGLTQLTQYAFRVAASNSAGLGTWSAWTNVTTLRHVTDSAWIGTDNGVWSLEGNWSAGIPSDAGDTARLGAVSGGRTTLLDAPGTVVAQVINDQNNAWTISPDANNYALTLQSPLGSALIRAKNGAGVWLTINLNVVIQSPLEIRAEGTDGQGQGVSLNGSLTGNGDVSTVLTGSGANSVRNISINAVGTVGAFSATGDRSANGVAVATVGALGSGVTTLTKSGTSTLRLTAANAFSGTTTVRRGVVQADRNGAFSKGGVSLLPETDTTTTFLPQLVFAATPDAGGSIDTIDNRATLTLRRAKGGATYYYSMLQFSAAATETVRELVFEDFDGTILARLRGGTVNRTSPPAHGLDFSKWFSASDALGSIEVNGPGTVILLR